MSTSARATTVTALALILGAAPAFAQGLGSRDGRRGVAQKPVPTPSGVPAQRGPGTRSPYGQMPGQERQGPQDTYAGQWKGEASWPLPGGVVMKFPISVDVQRAAQGYSIRYTADVPAQSAEIQPSPTRWTASFQARLQQAAPQPGAPATGQPTYGQAPYGQARPGLNQAPTPTLLMGQSQDYKVSIVNTGQEQGPWFVSIGLMTEQGQLVGQVGSPEIGFAQIRLRRAGAQAAGGLQGTWSGTATDSLDNGQPIQFPAKLHVTKDPNSGRISATYSSTIPYPDPASGRTVQLLVEETFSGTTQDGRTVLSCPNVRILEATSRQMLTSFPATLELTSDAQGLKGSLGSEEMGFTEMRLRRNGAGGMNPGGVNQGGMTRGGYGQQNPGRIAPGGWNTGGRGQGQGGWGEDVFGDEPDTWIDGSNGSGW